MISRLIRSVGYGWAMRSAAFLILALLAVANFTVRTRHPPSPKKISATQMLQPLRERGFIVLMAGMFVLTFGIFAPVTFLQVQALEAGMKPDLAQYLVAIFNAGRYDRRPSRHYPFLLPPNFLLQTCNKTHL